MFLQYEKDQGSGPVENVVYDQNGQLQLQKRAVYR